MKIYTIGFTKKSAAQFFQSLETHGIKKLIDIRLNNSSQLAAFTKKADLQYFLHKICGAEYVHLPILAPTQAMLDDYKKHNGSWNVYEQQFLTLMRERQIETKIEKNLFDVPSVLLCSEPTAEHRRLVLDYLQNFWTDLHAVHL
jgi:uncharacterized protein (DUF488 family)